MTARNNLRSWKWRNSNKRSQPKNSCLRLDDLKNEINVNQSEVWVWRLVSIFSKMGFGIECRLCLMCPDDWFWRFNPSLSLASRSSLTGQDPWYIQSVHSQSNCVNLASSIFKLLCFLLQHAHDKLKQIEGARKLKISFSKLSNLSACFVYKILHNVHTLSLTALPRNCLFRSDTFLYHCLENNTLHRWPTWNFQNICLEQI